MSASCAALIEVFAVAGALWCVVMAVGLLVVFGTAVADHVGRLLGHVLLVDPPVSARRGGSAANELELYAGADDLHLVDELAMRRDRRAPGCSS